jgi:hypothetical protein
MYNNNNPHKNIIINNKIGINIYTNYSIINTNNFIYSGNYHKERCINQKLYGIVLFKYHNYHIL